MVAPYSPTEEDFEKLYNDLPLLSFNLDGIIGKIKDNTGIILVGAFLYVIYNLPSCSCV